MILSRSSEYSIRAFLYLAEQQPGKLVMARHIAEEAGLPGHFLAKLLQQLARKGLVKSNKGPSGGFTLGMHPNEISLLEIVQAVDGADAPNTDLADESPRPVSKPHPTLDGWITVRSRIVDYLEHTSLADVAHPANGNGKKRKKSQAHVNGSK